MKNEREYIESWLKAEAQDHQEAADAALFRVFGTLPQWSPSTDFTDRVLLAAGIEPHVRAVVSWRARLAIAASLLGAGLAAAFLLPIMLRLLALVTPGEMVLIVAQGFQAGVHQMAEFLSFWQWIARFQETLFVVLTAPPVAVTLLALTGFSALTFRGLVRLLSPQRSSGYVQAHFLFHG